MTKTINNRKNMTTQELETVSGGVVPWAAISVGIAASITQIVIIKLLDVTPSFSRGRKRPKPPRKER